jgi:hypothetical protein
MTHGIEVNPEGSSRLHGVFRSPKREHVFFAGVEIIDEKVQVQLLGNWTVLWNAMVG